MARGLGRVIVVGNEKGGCGKTTLAVNLASMAATEGLDSVLVDADPGQHSAAKWSARRRADYPDMPIVQCLGVSHGNVAEELQGLAKRFAVVIIDTGGVDSPLLRSAATVANVLVVPTRPADVDLWTLPTMENVWKGAHAFNRRLRAVVALNQVAARSVDFARAKVTDYIATNVPKLTSKHMPLLVIRAAYGRVFDEGLGVGELPRSDPKATAEMQSLYDEVMS